jgi:hypothetical protein
LLATFQLRNHLQDCLFLTFGEYQTDELQRTRFKNLRMHFANVIQKKGKYIMVDKWCVFIDTILDADEYNYSYGLG